MTHNDHVWANGALVCNCGVRRKAGASSLAPPGWPGSPSEPVCAAPDSPMMVEFHAADAAVAKRIRDAVEALNILLGEAAKRNLDVEIESHDISAMGEYPRCRRIYEATVSRRTDL